MEARRKGVGVCFFGVGGEVGAGGSGSGGLEGGSSGGGGGLESAGAVGGAVGAGGGVGEGNGNGNGMGNGNGNGHVGMGGTSGTTALAERSCIAYMGTLVRNGECSILLLELNPPSPLGKTFFLLLFMGWDSFSFLLYGMKEGR